MYRFCLPILIITFLSLKLNAQTLETPEVIKVTYNIANNNVLIYWKASLSVETTSYEVWYADDQLTVGKVSFQKVPGSNRVTTSLPLQMEFEHDRALKNSMGYFITAFDNNKGESHIKVCDSTVFLSADFDSCLASATLQWNDYNQWRGNITGYKIYGSTDGNNYNLLQNLLGSTTSCTINNIEAYQLYRFYVLALKSIPSDSSYSNRVDINTKMAANPSYIYANYGTAESGHPVVNFTVDPTSELTNYVLLRADSPTGEFDSINIIHTINKIIDYSDNSVDASQQPYYYKLDALNHCGQIVRSSENMAGTIFLETNVSNKVVDLNWNSYQNWPDGVEHYILERNISGKGYVTITTTSDLYYTDHSFEGTGSQPTESDVCYRVTAVKNTSSSDPATSISNEVCVELNLNIRFEFNAFVPGSIENSTFGPVMDFIPKSVTFSIFNRWGNKLFETSDPNNLRWDGIYGGNKVDQGVYRYQLEYTNEKGKKSVMHGSVTVIYP
jgi:gliding motility-associated-like protein